METHSHKSIVLRNQKADFKCLCCVRTNSEVALCRMGLLSSGLPNFELFELDCERVSSSWQTKTLFMCALMLCLVQKQIFPLQIMNSLCGPRLHTVLGECGLKKVILVFLVQSDKCTFIFILD